MDERAEAKAVFVVLILVVAGFVAYFLYDVDRKKGDLAPPDVNFIVDAGARRFEVTLAHGEVEVSRLYVEATVDGGLLRLEPDELAKQLGDTWSTGEQLCLVGTGCYLESAESVQVRILIDEERAFYAERDLPD